MLNVVTKEQMEEYTKYVYANVLHVLYLQEDE